MNDLVQRLTQEQPIEASLRPEATVAALEAAIARGYVHVLFPNTRGGTELGIRVDPERSDTGSADYTAGTGSVRLVGTLVLDYVRVRFHGTLELPGLRGTGRLEVLEEVEPGQREATAG
jgi:hypothetical protein